MRFQVPLLLAFSALSVSGSIIKRGGPEILGAINAISAGMVTLDSASSGFPKSTTFQQVDAAGDLVEDKLKALVSSVQGSDKVAAGESAKITAAFAAQAPAIKKSVDNIVSKKAEFISSGHVDHVKMELKDFQALVRQTQVELAKKLTLDTASADAGIKTFQQIDGYFTAAKAAFA
jgi:hypothetical protein